MLLKNHKYHKYHNPERYVIVTDFTEDGYVIVNEYQNEVKIRNNLTVPETTIWEYCLCTR